MQTTVEKDPAAHTMTVTTELDVSVERAWQLWADPEQLVEMGMEEGLKEALTQIEGILADAA